MVSIKHKFHSSLPDSSNPSLIRPSNWNDTHAVSGLCPSVATREELKALDTGSFTAACLTESGREGMFAFKAGDYSTLVTADTQEGIHIESDGISASSGAWVRVFDRAASVKWFGAVEDGTTDDSAAIQAAVDTVYALGGGGVSLSGRFAIKSGIIVKEAVTLEAVTSQAERLSSSSKASAMILCSGSGYDAFTIGTSATDAYAAGIKGLSIFNAPQAGIVVNTHGGMIEGCAVNKSFGSGIVLNAGSGPTLIENTHVISPGKHGIEVIGGDNRIISSEVQQPNSSAVGLPVKTYDCIHITGGPCQIINCRLGDDAYNSRHGIYVSGGGLQITGTDIQNNTVAGIYIDGGNSHNIIGNRILSGSTDTNKAGIYFNADAFATVVSGNIFNGITTGGLGGIVFNVSPTRTIIKSNASFGNWNPPAFIVWVSDADRIAATNCCFENAHIRHGHSKCLVLSGATPSVDNGASADVFFITNASAQNVTDFVNGYSGQTITLIATDSNTTIVHDNAKIRLLNSNSWNMSLYSTLTLKKATSQATFGAVWYEVSRMNGQASAGGNNGGLSVGGQLCVYSGSSTPEGTVVAAVGSLYLRSDGGAGTSLYVKESGTGNTGWVAK